MVAAPTGMATTTRIRVSSAEHEVLDQVACLIGSLRRRDLAARSAAGVSPEKSVLARRKRDITSQSSSRWAGSIVRHNDAGYRLERRNQLARRESLQQAIAVIETRLAVPVPHVDPRTKNKIAVRMSVPGRRKTVTGYADQRERATKQRRLQHLRAELAQTSRDIATGRVAIVEGGKRLARNRGNLAAAAITETEWRNQWQAERAWFHANGAPDEPHGNLTITVTPDGTLSIRLPRRLEHLANSPRGRFVLAGKARFAHRGDAWAAHITRDVNGRAGSVSYRMYRCADRAGWYLTASWNPTPAADFVPARTPALDFPARVIGVDTNADHLACRVLDQHGNPDGPPIRLDLDLAGPASRRDAQLRHVLSRLIRIALRYHCLGIVIENLGFDDARSTGRETMGRGKKGRTFRRTVAGIPTARLRDRLAAMVPSAGLTLLGVDPAYTSIWGAQHWRKPLSTPQHEATRHEAAAVVIGRRGQGYRARRRVGKPASDQRIAQRRTTTQAVHHPDRGGGRTPRPARSHDDRRPTGRERRSVSRATVTPASPRQRRGADTVQQNQ